MKLKLIEITGPSGSGKTTLIERLLKTKSDCIDSYDYFLFQRKTKVHKRLKSFLVDLKSIFSLVRILQSERHRRLLALGLRQSFQTSYSILTKFNIFRNFYKKLAIDLYIRQMETKDPLFIIFDEGLFHMIHSLFVHPRSTYQETKLLAYLEGLPEPNKIVFLDASLETLGQRSHDRSDSPFALQGRDLDQFILAAKNLFQTVKLKSQHLDNLELNTDVIDDGVAEKIYLFLKMKATNPLTRLESGPPSTFS